MGETYELVIPGKFKLLAEQVSHHPPITSNIIIGDSGYVRHSSYRARQKFSKGSLQFTNMFKDYLELVHFNEKYEIVAAPISAHNLIIGTTYLDVSGKAYVRNL